jgi:hypothetical protein
MFAEAWPLTPDGSWRNRNLKRRRWQPKRAFGSVLVERPEANALQMWVGQHVFFSQISTATPLDHVTWIWKAEAPAFSVPDGG